ncbi:MAG TPA: ABC transporter substrate-binding protein [Clostridiales bacterium]|nr:ABC transporter substrate-binding protein [Clostridiales bacterium]
MKKMGFRSRVRQSILLSAWILLLGCTACQKTAGKETGPEENAIPIKWYLCSTGVQADVKRVEEAVEKYLADTYGMNISLDLVMYDFAKYGDKMRMILASDADYDICYTSSWSNNYFYYAGIGEFLPLNEWLLGEEKLKDSILPEVWEGIKVKGEIYGIPSNQIYSKQNYVTIVKEYADAYGLDVAKVHQLKDLDDFFHRVKADHPGIYPLALSEAGAMGKIQFSIGFENLTGEYLPGAIRLGDESLTVVNQYEMEEVKEYYEMMHRWSEDGIVRLDAALTPNNGLAGMKSGENIACVNPTFKPGADVTERSNFGGKEVVFAMLSDAWMTTESISSSQNAINRNTDHPETAFQLLKLVNTDPVLYNLLCFGIEGKHYERNPDGTVHLLEAGGYNPQADWAFGSQFLAMPREGQDKDIWEQTRRENQRAQRSPVLGFSFDTNGVIRQIAAVNAVLDQYRILLDTGTADPKKEYPLFLKKLKEAGSEDIVQEMERQLKVWARDTGSP